MMGVPGGSAQQQPEAQPARRRLRRVETAIRSLMNPIPGRCASGALLWLQPAPERIDVHGSGRVKIETEAVIVLELLLR